MWDTIELMVRLEIRKILEEIVLGNLETITNYCPPLTPMLASHHTKFPALGMQDIAPGKPSEGDTKATIPEHSGLKYEVILIANTCHGRCLFVWYLMQPSGALPCL